MVDKAAVRKVADIIAEKPGYLEKVGWMETMLRHESVDRDGEPVPWITYPSLRFLEPRIRPDMKVFEYGSGNSTLWWSRRVASVISCEHDKEWYAGFCPRVPENTTYLLRRAKGGCTAYAEEIGNYANLFDIVVIEGRDRINCIRNGIGALRRGGVVVWDNSDRSEYSQGYDLLKAKGYRRLDFWGMGPLSTREWCTSIFYREENCLGI